MTTLANANMLDDSIANSGSLKNQRLNKTAQKAVNPNPNPQTQEQVSEESSEEQYNQNEQREEYGKTQPNFSSANRNTKTSTDEPSDEKKILGMKPALFYTLLGVVVLVGGIIVYKKFIKKGAGKSLSKPDVGGASSATPDIKITP